MINSILEINIIKDYKVFFMKKGFILHVFIILVIASVSSFSMHGMEKQAETSGNQKKFQTCTLIGDDGSKVVIDADLIEKFLHGLGKKFNPNFKEGQTGEIILSDLNGQALQNLKTFLEKINALYVEFQAAQAKFTQQTQQQKENVTVLASGTLDEQNAAIAGQNAQRLKQLRSQLILDIKKVIEELPSIGDHFLDLFNRIVEWGSPVNVQGAFGLFAAENMDFMDPQNYALLTSTHFSPIAQLDYLLAHKLTPDNIRLTYEWACKLATNELIKIIPFAQKLFNELVNRLAQYTAENISIILQTNTDFKNLFKAPEMQPFALKLHSLFNGLMPKFNRSFTVSMASPNLQVLNQNCIVIFNADQIALYTLKPWKLLQIIKNQPIVKGYHQGAPMVVPSELSTNNHMVLLTNKRLISYWPDFKKSITVWDIEAAKPLFNHAFKLNVIKDVQSINDHQILVHSTGNLRMYDLNEPDQEPKPLNFNRVKAVKVIDNQKVLILVEKQIILWNPITKKVIKKWDTSLPFDTLTFFDNHHICMSIVHNGWGAYLPGSLPDSNLISSSLAFQILDLTSNNLLPVETRTTKDFQFSGLINANYAYTQTYAGLGFPPSYTSHLIDLKTNSLMGEFKHNSMIQVLDKNHIVFGRQEGNLFNIIIQFLPQLASLEEGIDELQLNVVTAIPQVEINQEKLSLKRPRQEVSEQSYKSQTAIEARLKELEQASNTELPPRKKIKKWKPNAQN